MTFYAEKYDITGPYEIKWKPETPVSALLKAKPSLRRKLYKHKALYGHEETEAAIKELNNALEQLKTVQIIPLRRGHEGQGFDYYAIRLVLNKKFLSGKNLFTQEDVYSEGILYFSTTNDAMERIKALDGYKVKSTYKCEHFKGNADCPIPYSIIIASDITSAGFQGSANWQSQTLHFYADLKIVDGKFTLSNFGSRHVHGAGAKTATPEESPSPEQIAYIEGLFRKIIEE